MSNVRWARIGFALLAWLFVAVALVQVYLAGAAMNVLGGGRDDFSSHQVVGWVLIIIALISLVLSFASRLDWRMVGASAVLLALMILQVALVGLSAPNLAALHPVNGFLVLLVSLWIAWRGWRIVRAPLPVEPVAATASSQMAPAMAQAAPAPAAPAEKPANEDDQ